MEKEKNHPVPGLALHVTASPVARGTADIAQGVVSDGRKGDLSPPLREKGYSSVPRGCLGLPFSMKQLKPSRLATRKQRGKEETQRVPAFTSPTFS